MLLARYGFNVQRAEGMGEQGGHKVGRETRLGFGLVSWSFDYESAATISQRPRPAPSQLTTASATTTTY